MTEAQKILSLIESVSPDDPAAMDEIDRLSAKYVCNATDDLDKDHDNWKNYRNMNREGGLTRSRDLLKAIRPDGDYRFITEKAPSFDIKDTSESCACTITREFDDDYKTFQHCAPTEELAELHAIIQAIEYERNSK